jgi:hypothetical protein
MLHRCAVPCYLSVARVVIAGFGIASVAWGLAVIPIFWTQSPIEFIAGKIVAGASYNTKALARQIASIEMAERAERCRPAAVRSAAIIRLHLLERTMVAAERSLIDTQMAALHNSIRRSIACSPADPLLWLVLYWVESAQNGFNPDKLEYVRLSYRLGQNEGWIGLKRNPAVLAIFEGLPPDLKEMVLIEFVALINSGFYVQAANIAMGQELTLRDQLLARLEQVGDNHRLAFARALREEGYEAALPEIKPRRERP